MMMSVIFAELALLTRVKGFVKVVAVLERLHRCAPDVSATPPLPVDDQIKVSEKPSEKMAVTLMPPIAIPNVANSVTSVANTCGTDESTLHPPTIPVKEQPPAIGVTSV